jgi:hypothetical protein
MKCIGKSGLVFLCVFSLFFFNINNPSTALAQKSPKATKAVKTAVPDKLAQANDAFDANKMGDMSDFDPANPIIPTGDTIKIAVVASFSGPAALVGKIYWASVLSAVHDINKRGGIMVDGKKKLVGSVQKSRRENGFTGKGSCFVGHGRKSFDEGHQPSCRQI